MGKPEIAIKWWKRKGRNDDILTSYGANVELNGQPLSGVQKFELLLDGGEAIPTVRMTFLPGSLKLEGPVMATILESDRPGDETHLEAGLEVTTDVEDEESEVT